MAERCRAVFDRRFLEEGDVEAVRAEIRELLESVRTGCPELDYQLVL